MSSNIERHCAVNAAHGFFAVGRSATDPLEYLVYGNRRWALLGPSPASS